MINIFITAYILSCFKEVALFFLSRTQVTVSYPTAIHEQQCIVAILDEAFEGIATASANAKKNLNNARAVFDSYLKHG